MVDNNIAERERGRMALAFLADAGFDPRQAPEAWRLLRQAICRKTARS
jgi:hypothetical protein